MGASFRHLRVHEDLRAVVWPNGLNPSPELLRNYLTPTSVDSAAA